MPQEKPFGTWKSPVTTQSLVSGSVGISEVIPDGDDVWWAESRPEEAGRTALMRWRGGQSTEITPPESSVRTTVHEYGGGGWWVENKSCYFVDYRDQRLRGIRTVEETLTEPLILTEPASDGGSLRYSDFRPTIDGQWLLTVCEEHLADKPGAVNSKQGKEPRNSLRAVATDGSGRFVEIASGADFYASPRPSPDGLKLCWVEWSHPNMPWDDTLLMSADLLCDQKSIELGNIKSVAGGPGEAIVQPEWSPNNQLHFLSDRENLWHLYREGQAQAVLQVDGEIGYPPWVFGLSRYCFLANGEIVAARFHLGVEYLPGYEQYTAFHSIRSSGNKVSFVAASWSSEGAVMYGGRVIRQPRDSGFGDEAFSQVLFAAPQRLEFPTSDNDTAYALFFKPSNASFTAPSGEKPPLIVLAHGGPTSAARSQLSLSRQFWTSRGFAVVDVNYRGSSGFGRAYRKKLDEKWGLADVEDCVNVARFLADRGDVDAKRLIIRGGSAGGFTVLSALAFHDTFTAGASMYGVADLEALAEDTHKFESRYLDNLVGPYPEEKKRYQERSPIHHLEGFSAPMIVLQGSEDRIVPPNQSRMIVDALRERGVAVSYLEFEGEQHGFRKAETIEKALASELVFYGKIFGFVPAGELPTLEIFNLDGLDT